MTRGRRGNQRMTFDPKALVGNKPSRRMTGGSAPVGVAFVGGNGFPPEDTGGLQSSTHDLARRLKAAGHRPTILASLHGSGTFGFAARVKLKATRSAFAVDHHLGYPAYRCWSPQTAADAFIRAVRPDVAVVQGAGCVPLAQAFRARGIPVVLYLRTVEFDALGGDPRSAGAAAVIANSRFTADVYRRNFNLSSHVIPPTIERSRVAVAPRGEAVVFVNPVAEKGLDRAIEIASACADIPFLFVESWPLSEVDIATLRDRLSACPNVTFERRREDVRNVYARARLVLMPSLWQEAWGRVASEAQCSGIPVLGSNRGGLPEAIGPGGLVLPVDAPLSVWTGAVRRFWDDEAHHARVSRAARDHADRPEMDANLQFHRFLGLIRSVLSAGYRQKMASRTRMEMLLARKESGSGRITVRAGTGDRTVSRNRHSRY